MGSKSGNATLVRVIVLIAVALLCGLVGFIAGFGSAATEYRVGTGVGHSMFVQHSELVFFEGLGVGLMLFFVLMIAMLWHSHQIGVNARCEELTYRVDKLQRELMDLRAATERKPVDALPGQRA